MPIENTLNRKQQIEETATGLFRSRGYAATSMRDLAQELDIEAASLYAHIKSKEAILREICFKMADLFFEALERVKKSNGSATERLESAIMEHVKVITKDVAASAVFLNEWRHMSEPYLSDFIKLRDDYENLFIDILNEGKASGELDIPDVKFVAKFILSSLNWTHNWYKPEGKMSPGEAGKKLAGLLIDGLKGNRQNNKKRV